MYEIDGKQIQGWRRIMILNFFNIMIKIMILNVFGTKIKSRSKSRSRSTFRIVE